MGLIGLAALFAIGALVKTVLWIVLLPLRLVFWIVGGLIVLPLLLFKFVAGAIIFVIALPVIVVSVLAALLVPLVPVIFLVALVWFLIRPEATALVRI
jgi:hypothetical protein